jgi:hypothetical protein
VNGLNVANRLHSPMQASLVVLDKNYHYAPFVYRLGHYIQVILKCSCCSNTFNRNKKPKTDIVFCSRKCAGEGHKGRKMSL